MVSPYAVGTGLLGRGEPVEYEPDVVPQQPTGPTQTPGCGSLCGITDTFTRTLYPYDGGYYQDVGGWGVSDAGVNWQGSSLGAFVDGQDGVLGIYNNANPANGAPSWALPDWIDGNIWSQIAYLNWSPDSTPMDITLEMRLTRSLAVSDSLPFGNQGAWGEYLWIFFGDGPPYGFGKFNIVFAGNMGGAYLFLYSDDGETAWASYSAIDMTQPFKLRMTSAGAGQPYNAYIWQSSNTQPSSPTLTITGTTWSNHGLTIELNTDNGEISSPLELHVLSVDVVGLNRCSEYRFDNFNRTVAAGGWGTSDFGLAWGTSGSYETAGMSVNGTYAVVAANLADIEHAEAYIDVTGAGTAPWNSAPTFTMRAHVFIPHVVATSDTGVVFRFITIPFSEGPQLWVTRGSDFFAVQLQGNDGWNSSYIELATDPEWLNILWEVAPQSQHRVKCWEDGAPEPAEWLLTQDDTAGVSITGRSNFIVDVFMDSGTARSTYIDYIDFDYAGKPCYAISTGIFDDFNRTLASGWGTASGGAIWTVEPDAHSGSDSSHIHYSVNGSSGVMAVDAGWSGNAIAAPIAFGKTFTMTARWRPDRSGCRLYFSSVAYGYWDDPIGAFEIQFTQPSGTNAYVGMTGASPSYTTIPDWTLGTDWLLIELTATGSGATLMVRKESVPQPYYVGPSDISAYDFNYLNIEGYPYAIDYIDFDYEGKTTYVYPI